MMKIAILIDGGYLLKRLPTVRADIDQRDAQAVSSAIWQLVTSHLERENNKAAGVAHAHSLAEESECPRNLSIEHVLPQV